jgi:hypothetical protein
MRCACCGHASRSRGGGSRRSAGSGQRRPGRCAPAELRRQPRPGPGCRRPRLGRDRTAVACAGVLTAFVLVAVCAPLLSGVEGQTYAAVHTELVDAYGYPTIGPGWRHWFGVEPRLGRDLFARWAYGARPSLVVATTAAVAATTLGVSLGWPARPAATPPEPPVGPARCRPMSRAPAPRAASVSPRRPRRSRPRHRPRRRRRRPRAGRNWSRRRSRPAPPRMALGAPPSPGG